MTEVSVVIPTKNEEASIGICIEKVQGVFAEHHIDGEIVVADNSTDRTPDIAKRPGARVVVPDEHGYGKMHNGSSEAINRCHSQRGSGITGSDSSMHRGITL